jgi:hypothetical protein
MALTLPKDNKNRTDKDVNKAKKTTTTIALPDELKKRVAKYIFEQNQNDVKLTFTQVITEALELLLKKHQY